MNGDNFINPIFELPRRFYKNICKLEIAGHSVSLYAMVSNEN